MDRTKRIKTKASGKDTNNEQNSSIFSLNDDCMRHIFSFLSTKERVRAQRVYQKWRRLGKLPWTDKKKLNIYGPGYSQHIDRFVYDLAIVKQVLRLCGKSLTDLKLLLDVDLPPTALLKLVKQFCPNIRSLNLSGIKLTPQAAKFLAKNFKNLTFIYLGQCRGYDDTPYYEFLSANTKLRTFHIRSDTIRGWCLRGLPRDSIENVKIIRCDEFSAKDVLNALKKLTKLRSLSVILCDPLRKNLNSLLDILSKKSNFEEFEIEHRWTRETSNSILAPNFSKMVNLKHSSLQGHTLIHDEALKIIGAYCKHLSKVSLTVSAKVTDRQLQIFLESLHLEELMLGKLKSLSETFFNSVHMPSLKSLKFHDLPQLTDKNLMSLLQSSYKLERVEIMYCKNVDSYNFIRDVGIYVQERSQDTILELCLGSEHIVSEYVIQYSPQLRIIHTPNRLDFW